MRNNSTFIVTTVVSSFLFGVVFGVFSYNLANDNNATRAKRNSVGGHYGGGKCFIGGLEPESGHTLAIKSHGSWLSFDKDDVIAMAIDRGVTAEDLK